MSRDFLSNYGLRAKATVVWMIFSASFAIAFPTLVSAMTGYSSNIQGFVTIDDNLVPFADFQVVKYIIHDGRRIGLSADYVVAGVPDGKLNSAAVASTDDLWISIILTCD